MHAKGHKIVPLTWDSILFNDPTHIYGHGRMGEEHHHRKEMHKNHN